MPFIATALRMSSGSLGYQYVEIYITAQQTASFGPSMADIRFVAGGVDYPTENMTGNSSPGPSTVSAFKESNPAYYATDSNTTGTEWGSDGTVPAWWRIDFGSRRPITAVKITPPTLLQACPKDYQIRGYPNGFSGSYDVLYSVTGDTSWTVSPQTQKTILF